MTRSDTADAPAVRGESYLIERVSDEGLRRDLAVIRDELHCTAVMVATAAERLPIGDPGWVTPLVDSEFSHTVPGIVPGSWSYVRLVIILWTRRLLRARIIRRLDELLAREHAVASGAFHGPIYYAGGWEEVDRRRVDLVGRHDKPGVGTQVGGGALVGAGPPRPRPFPLVGRV